MYPEPYKLKLINVLQFNYIATAPLSFESFDFDSIESMMAIAIPYRNFVFAILKWHRQRHHRTMYDGGVRFSSHIPALKQNGFVEIQIENYVRHLLGGFDLTDVGTFLVLLMKMFT